MDLRLLRSLLYLRPSQVPQRAWRLGAERLLLSRLARRLVEKGSSPRTAAPTTHVSPRAELWQGRETSAQEVLEACKHNRFDLLGEERAFQAHIRWDDPTLGRLWRFTLNYFGFAWPLRLCGEPGGRELARLFDDWHSQQPPRRGDPWHPFVIAERLINLLGTRDAWVPYAAAPEALLGSLAGQAWYLRRTVERDIGGNHLIRDAAALTVAGEAFHDPALLQFGLELISGALSRQILADGMHEERSASYHLEVLTDLVEVRRIVAPDQGLARRLDIVLADMSAATNLLRHPDGSIPHFNDTTAWPVKGHRYTQQLGLTARPILDLPSGGYFVLERGDTRMIVDAGPPSPRDLPPHAHCDALSFEMAVGELPLIVNSGTGDYEAGPWRDYWRSTRAHNTVEVNGEEQSEVWDSFRMARRASVFDVVVRRDKSWCALGATHDGYSRLPQSILHRRTIVAHEGVWFVIDQLEGDGSVRVRSFLHRHPDASIHLSGSGFVVERMGARVTVVPLGPLPATFETASKQPIANWYADTIGDRLESTALVLSGSTKLPSTLGWAISSTGPLSAPRLQVVNGTPSLTVTHNGKPLKMDLTAWRSVNR